MIFEINILFLKTKTLTFLRYNTPFKLHKSNIVRYLNKSVALTLKNIKMKDILTVKNTIEKIIQGEIKEIIQFEKAPFIKFQLLSTSLEFLGACMDNKEFYAKKSSEERFNKALIKLMPKKYHKYAKNDSAISLYSILRCGMIHKLRPLNDTILLSERKNIEGDINMTEINNQLIIILEDFYDDINQACENLKKLYETKKLPNKKLEENYIEVINGFSGTTENNITK
ncbi:hypothetical protein DM790_22480 [Flavobacterium collinsii]|nr:hypothetical protein [Flavobacterium collinsii]